MFPSLQWVARYLTILMATIPIKTSTAIPTIYMGTSRQLMPSSMASTRLYMPAPNRTGIDIKKENLTAKLLSKSQSIPDVMVLPVLDSPGKTETA